MGETSDEDYKAAIDEIQESPDRAAAIVASVLLETDMSDRGSDDVKSTIQGMLDKFLEDDSPLKPVETKTPPAMTEPGPVALYAPVKN